MLTIGKLSTLAELSTTALRFYEREGLLAPASKSPSGYRLYDRSALPRVRFIKSAQQCGFTLAEISELLALRAQDSACCTDIRKVAVEKRIQLEAKIRSMKVMARALDLVIEACPDEGRPLEDCPILAAMEQAGGSRTA
jgi:DNA-binding transcriptional MerR regulator